MGDFNFPDVSWEYLIADTNSFRKFLKNVDDNFVVHVLRELIRKGAFPGLLLINREGVMGEVGIGNNFGHSDHEVVEVQIFGDRRKTVTKTSTLNIGRVDFRLLRELVTKNPWDSAFKVLESTFAGQFIQ